MSQSASKGLGDDIEKITKATGIKKVVDTFAELTGIDCGCDARKKKLNEMFRYTKPECLTENEFDYLTEVFSTGNTTIPSAQQMKMINIYIRG